MRVSAAALGLFLALTGCQVPLAPAFAPPRAETSRLLGPAGADADEPERRGAGHVAGDRMFVVDAHYGIPILQRAIFWDGNAEIDNFGLGASNYWFTADWFAWRASLNFNVFKQTGPDAFAAELELGGRFYLLDFDNWSAYWDQTAGFEQASDQVPTGGTYWNMTFSFGPGADIKLSEDTNLLIGATFHHMSNALGRTNGRNPSQNEGRFYIGYGWVW